MNTVLLFLALVGAGISSALPDDASAHINENAVTPRPLLRVEPVAGAPAQKPQRLSSCTPAAEGQFPFVVALFFDGGWFCSGSLINPCTILTAAHCTDGARSVTAYLGSTQLYGGTRVTATEFTQHPNYDGQLIINDVALIHLPSSVSGPYIGPVAGLAPSNAGTYAGETAIAVGWGINRNGSGINPTLCWVSVQIITPAQCAAVYGPSTSHNSVICSRGPGNNGACSVGSGGPLIQASTGIQIGVVSFAAANACEAGYPSGYARVSNLRSWIDANLRSCPP